MVGRGGNCDLFGEERKVEMTVAYIGGSARCFGEWAVVELG